MASRDIKKSVKIEKGHEGHRGQFKGQKVLNIRIVSFFLIVETIWYQLLWKFSIFKFQGRKGQKGRYSS